MTARRSASARDPQRKPPSRGGRPWVLVDTNIFFLVFSSAFPLETLVRERLPEARIGVPAGVLGELDRLTEKGEPNALSARKFAMRYPRIAHTGRGDIGILRAARRHRGYVVTSDRALVRRLRDQGTTVFVPRDRARLELLPGRSPARRPARPRRRERFNDRR